MVLIPAHNEGLYRIQQTLTALNAQTVPADRLIVADNCTDQTAS